jgi:hypothetical protein
MSSRIKFFLDKGQAQATREFLNAHGIKSFLRERTSSTIASGEMPYGVDVFVLREEDVLNARKLLDYEFGDSWGELSNEL